MAEEQQFLSALPELVNLLSDPKAKVREGAGEIILGISTEPYFIEYCKKSPKKILRALTRIAEGTKQNIQITTPISDLLKLL